jgi:hypothetical protein
LVGMLPTGWQDGIDRAWHLLFTPGNCLEGVMIPFPK